MNLFRVLIQQVDDAGAFLLRRMLIIKQGGRSKIFADYFFAVDNQSRQRAVFRGAAIRPEDWKQFPKGTHPVLRALICHVKDEPLSNDELLGLTRALNRPILGLGNQITALGFPYCLGLTGNLARVLADLLVNYLSFFHRDPRLFKNKPIGLCPVCDGLFLKLKANQQYCSGDCRFKNWTAKYPDYWWKGKRYFAKKRKARETSTKKS